MRMQRYYLTDMSEKGREALPGVLDEMGYAGRYTMSDSSIAINSNMIVLSKAIKRAEDIAHDEPGHLVCIKQETYSKVWIPETEAATQDAAYLRAAEMVENCWKVDNDAETSVKAPVEDRWIDSYLLESLRNGRR